MAAWMGQIVPWIGRAQCAHLDSKLLRHHDAFMRTTVTLDADVLRQLRREMHRSRRSFKEALNAAVRAGLARSADAAPPEPFVVKARPMGLRPGLDPGGLNKLADDLETDALIEAGRRRRRR
jgi:hypothetical protein